MNLYITTGILIVQTSLLLSCGQKFFDDLNYDLSQKNKGQSPVCKPIKPTTKEEEPKSLCKEAEEQKYIEQVTHSFKFLLQAGKILSKL